MTSSSYFIPRESRKLPLKIWLQANLKLDLLRDFQDSKRWSILFPTRPRSNRFLLFGHSPKVQSTRTSSLRRSLFPSVKSQNLEKSLPVKYKSSLIRTKCSFLRVVDGKDSWPELSLRWVATFRLSVRRSSPSTWQPARSSSPPASRALTSRTSSLAEQTGYFSKM